jgi:putative SOS response-associated peptidase YedK
MCYHNSINTDKQHLERKYKKKLNQQVSIFSPIHHASGFDFGIWPMITKDSTEIELFNWGLVPSWTKTYIDAKSIKAQTLNARIETISEKASFKNAKRCLVSSTGFFEWQTVGSQKIPYFIKLKEQEIFSMAGLYDSWINEKGELTYSFSIVTTEANSLMAGIHNVKKRMPVILNDSQEENWLDSKNEILDFKTPFKSEQMQAHTISNIISSKDHNSPKVNQAKIIEVQEQLRLF